MNATMLAWLADGRPVAEAIVIDTIGSPPVPVGGRMVIAGEDDFLGSVSGGCVEADVIAAALDGLSSGTPQTLTFGIGDHLAWRAGLACGSTIRVAILPVRQDDGALIADVHRRVERERLAHTLVTDLKTGERRLATAISDTSGSPVADAQARGQSCVYGRADAETFVHIIKPAPRLVLVGATHVAQALSQMAKAAGYSVVVLDPRSAFTSASRFDAETAITGWPEQAIGAFASDPNTAIVTLTHVGHIDDEALKLAVRAPCRYVGALGSRKTHAARSARMKDAGYSDAEIGRIHAPVGLDLGGRAPGEIAVAILAQIVAAFNGRDAA